jgi:plasmid rolling circle replication initiator protein Rep
VAITEDVYLMKYYDMTDIENVAELMETYLDSTRALPDGTVYHIKAFVVSAKGLSIVVYPKDHDYQPHFHVISKQRNIDARFDLNTLEHISNKRGQVAMGDVRKIQEFFKERPEMLEALRLKHAKLNT